MFYAANKIIRNISLGAMLVMNSACVAYEPEPAPPPPVVYAPPPGLVYAEPAPVYYAAPPVAYLGVGGGYGRGYYGRGRY